MLNAQCSQLFHAFLITTKIMISQSVNGLLLYSLSHLSHNPQFPLAHNRSSTLPIKIKRKMIYCNSILHWNSIPFISRIIIDQFIILVVNQSPISSSQSNIDRFSFKMFSYLYNQKKVHEHHNSMGPAFYHQHNILMYICQLGSLFSPKPDASMQTHSWNWIPIWRERERERAGKRPSKGEGVKKLLFTFGIGTSCMWLHDIFLLHRIERWFDSQKTRHTKWLDDYFCFHDIDVLIMDDGLRLLLLLLLIRKRHAPEKDWC